MIDIFGAIEGKESGVVADLIEVSFLQLIRIVTNINDDWL